MDMAIKGLPSEIYGIVSHESYVQNWRMLDGMAQPWTELHENGAVVINEQLAYHLDLQPGDMLALTDDWSVQIAGIFGDYGNPKGNIILRMPEFMERFPDVPRQRFGIHLPEEEITSFVSNLHQSIELPPDAVIAQARLKAISLSIFEQTFTVTSALNVLTLAIAGFAILTSMATLASLRLPQLAPVWALGMTRRELAFLELCRTVVLAFLTALVALPLGLALAWILLNIVNVEAFGWRLPMFLFPGDWALLAALTLAASALAGWVPVRRLKKTPPAELLKVFAHER